MTTRVVASQPVGTLRRVPSLAGRFFKTYRKLYALTQEQLAERLSMEPRLLRAYENGERQLNNIRELRRIVEALRIAPEYLGVAASPWVLTGRLGDGLEVRG